MSRLLREGYDVSYPWCPSNESVSNIQTEAYQFNGVGYPYQSDLANTDTIQPLADILSQGITPSRHHPLRHHNVYSNLRVRTDP